MRIIIEQEHEDRLGRHFSVTLLDDDGDETYSEITATYDDAVDRADEFREALKCSAAIVLT